MQEIHQLPLLHGGRVQDGLARGEGAQLVRQVAYGPAAVLHGGELARGDVAEGRRRALVAGTDGAQVVGAALVEHGLVRHGAGRYYAHHLTLDQAFCGGRVLHLLADGDLVALLQQLGDI